MASALLKALEEEKSRNFKQRLDFVRLWANYVRTHSNDVWSRQQASLINSQTGEGMTLENYLRMKHASGG